MERNKQTQNFSGWCTRMQSTMVLLSSPQKKKAWAECIHWLLYFRRQKLAHTRLYSTFPNIIRNLDAAHTQKENNNWNSNQVCLNAVTIIINISDFSLVHFYIIVFAHIHKQMHRLTWDLCWSWISATSTEHRHTHSAICVFSQCESTTIEFRVDVNATRDNFNYSLRIMQTKQ